MKQRTLADVATIKDSVIDRKTVSSVIVWKKVDQGVLCDRPIKGTIRRSEAIEAPSQRTRGIALGALIILGHQIYIVVEFSGLSETGQILRNSLTLVSSQ